RFAGQAIPTAGRPFGRQAGTHLEAPKWVRRFSTAKAALRRWRCGGALPRFCCGRILLGAIHEGLCYHKTVLRDYKTGVLIAFPLNRRGACHLPTAGKLAIPPGDPPEASK